jgi:nicotinate-nucleotide--dimethylbenzimidazole phosphoribosyltransferase
LGSPSTEAAEAARRHWDAIAKPLGSLGLLEDAIVRIAAIIGTPDVRLNRRAVAVLCADNGVVAEGVTQTDASVTMAVARNLTKRGTSVCLMARAANCDVIPVDMGMLTRPDFDGVLDRHVADGTGNIAVEPAMTREQAETAVQHGIELANTLKSQGYDVICTGEMGIGNTTTSSAVAAALMNLPPERVTGRGSGLSDDGLRRKVSAITRALALHRPNPDDALGVLASVGGFDICGMAGLFIGGAIARIPVVIDGFISASAALAATRIAPDASHAILASHVSGEPAGRLVLDALGLKPLIDAGMRLGEGTGAVALLPLLDLALAVYHGSSGFGDIGVDQYTPQQ